MKKISSLFFCLLLSFVLFSCDTDYVNQDKTFSREHGEVGFFYVMLSNVEGHAKVRYSDKFGLAPADKVFQKHAPLGATDLPTLYKAGYIFDGWFNGSEQAIPGVFSVDKNVTLVAKWTPITYTVYFYPNNSSGASPLTQEFTYDTKAKLLANTFTPATHMKFVGWATASDNSASFQDEEEVLNLADYQFAVVSLYAVWIDVDTLPIIYHGYDSDTDTKVGELPKSYHENDASVSIGSLTREGYTFLGWYDNDSFSGSPITGWTGGTKSGTVDLYAKWTPCWKVHFDKNGADVSGDFADVEVNDANSFLLPANPFTRDKYFFEGWSLEPDGSGANYSAGQNVSVTSNMTFYAKWHAYRYITFDANGGSGTMDTMVVQDGVSTAISANTFTRTHYEFASWKDSSGKSYSNKQSVVWKADTTLYAQWNPVSYTITFNGNKPTNETGFMTGGTGSQNVTYGTSSTVKTCGFTCTHYNFKCWNTKADGSGTNYSANDNNYKISLTGSITLYAQWTGKNYKITFNSNGTNHKTSGGADSYTQSYTWGSSVTLTANKFNGNYDYTYLYEKDGMGNETKYTKTLKYNLSGWSATETDSTPEYTPGKTISPCLLGNKTLYAVWNSPNSYIIYHANMDVPEYSDRSSSDTSNNYWTDAESVVECSTSQHTILSNADLDWKDYREERRLLGWGTTELDYVHYRKNGKLNVDTTKPIHLFGVWYHGGGSSMEKSSNLDDNTNYNLFMEKYETTRGNFYKVMKDDEEWKKVDLKAEDIDYPENLLTGNVNPPRVDIKKVCEYCNKLSDLLGYDKVYTGSFGKSGAISQDCSKNGFRLPTKDEWRYFVSDRNAWTLYPQELSYSINDVAWHSNNSGGRVQKVGQKLESAFSLCDVVGNLAELAVYSDTYNGIFDSEWGSGNVLYHYYYVCGGSYNDGSNKTVFDTCERLKYEDETQFIGYCQYYGFRLVRTENP